MQRYHDTLSVIQNKNIVAPQHLFRPHAIDAAVACFKANFPGIIAYAVKSNPEKHVLERLIQAGITTFDVASLHEIQLIRSISPSAYLYFMHTVKSRQAIARAYDEYNVRDFSLDSAYELTKIMQETKHASDINLFVRIAVPNLHSKISLAGKFGIDPRHAVDLLKEARKHSVKLGVSFHVGSQCENPESYELALASVAKLIKDSGVRVDIVNVGGGFPALYPGMSWTPIDVYFRTIQRAFAKIRHENPWIELMGEPGRALVAESGAEIVRVDLIKGNQLYINDGTYGALFDAGAFNQIYPVKIIRTMNTGTKQLAPYSFFGPTCDAIDYMRGPFYLPNDIKEGDFFEIGQLGAYSRTLTTGFNGFSQEDEIVEVADWPLLSLYTPCRISNKEFLAQSYLKELSHEQSIACA